jgi:chemotaxis receptor (MCP) glutamine deamidase CheD
LRNTLIAKRLLRQNGVQVHGEAVGGNVVRTVTLVIATGHVKVSSGRGATQEMRR